MPTGASRCSYGPPATSVESPVAVDGRKLRRTALWHFSWLRILTEAVVQNQLGVDAPFGPSADA